MLKTPEINFYKLRSNQLQESFLSMFGETIKAVLKRMFGKIPSPEEYKQMVAEGDVLTPEDKQQPLPQGEEPAEQFQLVLTGTDDDIASFLDALKAELNNFTNSVKGSATPIVDGQAGKNALELASNIHDLILEDLH